MENLYDNSLHLCEYESGLIYFSFIYILLITFQTIRCIGSHRRSAQITIPVAFASGETGHCVTSLLQYGCTFSTIPNFQ